jgi:hypothetical protein
VYSQTARWTSQGSDETFYGQRRTDACRRIGIANVLVNVRLAYISMAGFGALQRQLRVDRVSIAGGLGYGRFSSSHSSPLNVRKFPNLEITPNCAHAIRASRLTASNRGAGPAVLADPRQLIAYLTTV